MTYFEENGYNILNKGAVSQMKPDRRQNKCYKNKRLTLPEQGRLSSIAAYRNNKKVKMMIRNKHPNLGGRNAYFFL